MLFLFFIEPWQPKFNPFLILFAYSTEQSFAKVSFLCIMLPIPPPPSMKNLDCIMLVDDDKTSSFLFQHVLEETPFQGQMIVCRSGQEGLQYLRHPTGCRPNIILVDVNMPVMDGFEFVDSYKRLLPEQYLTTLVVMLSSSFNPLNEQKAAQAGLPCLEKPLGEEDLLEIVEHFWTNRSQDGL